MKKILLILAMAFGVTGCYHPSEPIESMSRNATWNGQSIVDMYDNFGIPTARFVNSNGITVYYYHNPSISRYGNMLDYYYCDMTFYLQNDTIIDWFVKGDKCNLRNRDASHYLRPPSHRTILFGTP